MTTPPVPLSGKVTADHPIGMKWEKIPDSIRQETIFHAQWSDCPVEVEEEVKRLWRMEELRNDNCYVAWNPDAMVTKDENWNEGVAKEVYPMIHWWLTKKGVTGPVLIHWWW